MKNIKLITLSLVLIILSILIGNIKLDKLKIVSSSIPSVIKKGETFNIEVKTNKELNDIKYSSTDTNIVSITDGGLVIPIDKGVATITAYYEGNNGTIYDKIEINVTE